MIMFAVTLFVFIPWSAWFPWFHENLEDEKVLEEKFFKNEKLFNELEAVALDGIKSNQSKLENTPRSKFKKLRPQDFHISVYSNEGFLLVTMMASGLVNHGFHKGYAWVAEPVADSDNNEWVKLIEWPTTTIDVKKLSGKWFIYRKFD